MLLSRRYVIPKGGISEVEKLSIGGIEQTILIQATKSSNPILLFLHGGPSMPLPGVSSRGMDYTVATNTKELVKHFIVVFWDQRGTGKSFQNSIPKESMNLQQFIRDADELTDYLRKRFKKEKIFLAAHSFGSLIGLNLVKQSPEKFYSYTGLSQLVNWTKNDKISYIWLQNEAEKRGDKRALKELHAVGEPPYIESFKQWSVLRKWQTRFKTLVYTDKDIKHPGLVKVIKGMCLSKDYSLKDIYNTFYKGFKLIYTQQFIESLPSIDLKETVKEIEVPVTFIHGIKDMHIHGDLVEDYIKVLVAKKSKRLIWVEKSAHLFHPDDAKIIEQNLIDQVKYVNHIKP